MSQPSGQMDISGRLIGTIGLFENPPSPEYLSGVGAVSHGGPPDYDEPFSDSVGVFTSSVYVSESLQAVVFNYGHASAEWNVTVGIPL
jgi:hypothetical protein